MDALADIPAPIGRIRMTQKETEKPHGEAVCRDWVVWRGHYRTDVAVLLSEIDRLNEENDRLREQLHD